MPSIAAFADALMLVAVATGTAALRGGPVDGTRLAGVLGHVSAVDAGPLVPLDPPHFNAAVSDLAAGHDIDVQGASGHLDFDVTTGEAPSDINIYEIVDGGIRLESVIHP
jgi:branched-chain amino acid transport system substrate-binding protein